MGSSSSKPEYNIVYNSGCPGIVVSIPELHLRKLYQIHESSPYNARFIMFGPITGTIRRSGTRTLHLHADLTYRPATTIRNRVEIVSVRHDGFSFKTKVPIEVGPDTITITLDRPYQTGERITITAGTIHL